MKIIELTEHYYEEYEKFLSNREESLLYYSIKYKNLLEQYLKCKSLYLLAIDKFNKIRGILPLMLKTGRYGKVLNSLPFYGSNGGILADNYEAYELLRNYYNNLIKKVNFSTYISNSFKDNSKGIRYDLLDERIGQWTFIGYKDNIEENLMKSFKSSARRNIRKALRFGIDVSIDNSQIDFLYKLHYDNITSIKGKPKEKAFFRLINKHFDKGIDYNIYISSLNNKKISALLLFYFNKKVEYFTPAIIKDFRTYQPNSLIIYKAMIDASKKGYIWWNWGGTWISQEGVYKFKKKFASVERVYKYLIAVNSQEIVNLTKEDLLKEYDNFYVVPFNILRRK